MLKKLLCLLLCLAMLSGLSACGGIGDGEGTTTADGTTTDNIETTTPEEVTTPDPLEVLIPPADVERDWVTILNGKEVKGITEEELEAYVGDQTPRDYMRHAVYEKDGKMIVAHLGYIDNDFCFVYEIQSFDPPQVTEESFAKLREGMSPLEVIRLVGAPSTIKAYDGKNAYAFVLEDGSRYYLGWGYHYEDDTFFLTYVKHEVGSLSTDMGDGETWTTLVNGEVSPGLLLSDVISEATSTFRAWHYTFFATSDGKVGVAENFPQNTMSGRVREVQTFDAPEATQEAFAQIKPGMSIFELAELVGMPYDTASSMSFLCYYSSDKKFHYNVLWEIYPEDGSCIVNYVKKTEALQEEE